MQSINNNNKMKYINNVMLTLCGRTISETYVITCLIEYTNYAFVSAYSMNIACVVQRLAH